MKQTLHIVKIGGKIINTPELLDLFLAQFRKIEGKKILVHGGGRDATLLAERLGIEQTLVDGRRITDIETLKIITMVYAGSINKNIVSKLQAMNVNAMGLSGADGNLISSHRRQNSNIDYGYVGDIDSVNVQLLELIVGNNIVPVICPLTHDGQGLLLNTNADTIASKIAVFCQDKWEVALSYCFEHKGVLVDVENPEITVESISSQTVDEMIKKSIIDKGLLPKVSNALNAAQSGIQNIVICGIDNLLNQEQATRITK